MGSIVLLRLIGGSFHWNSSNDVNPTSQILLKFDVQVGFSVSWRNITFFSNIPSGLVFTGQRKFVKNFKFFRLKIAQNVVHVQVLVLKIDIQSMAMKA